jgi:hypothetical protein
MYDFKFPKAFGVPLLEERLREFLQLFVLLSCNIKITTFVLSVLIGHYETRIQSSPTFVSRCLRLQLWLWLYPAHPLRDLHILNDFLGLWAGQLIQTVSIKYLIDNHLFLFLLLPRFIDDLLICLVWQVFLDLGRFFAIVDFPLRVIWKARWKCWLI